MISIKKNKHVDFLGNDINIGDDVVFVKHNMRLGTVEYLTPKMVSVVSKSKYTYVPSVFKIYPHDLVVVPADQAALKRLST